MYHARDKRQRSSEDATKHTIDVHGHSKSPADPSSSASSSGVASPFPAVTSTGEVFDTSGVDYLYKPIDSYEGRHRFDPDFQWDAKEERRVVRKLDLRICSWVCFAFFALQLDRSNITQAVSDNMIPDLGMNTNDYNTGQTIFYVTFLCAELPSQMISKRLGPDRWIPLQMVSWSIIASMQAFLSGRSSFFITRALLGIFEGGFIPDNVLYLSYFYTSKELPVRLSAFWTSYRFTYIVSAFLAFGVLHMAGVNGMAGWRWLFALEGALTGLIGIATYFYLPPSPYQTASRLRGKNGWFTEREEKIMANRILRDDPSKGDMHNRQAIDWRAFWHCLCDYDMWPIYFIGLSWLVPMYPSEQYLTLILKSDGFDTFQSNLLSIPAYVIFIINLLVFTQISERINERFLLVIASELWALGPLIALEVLPGGSSGSLRWGRYACTILIVGSPYLHAVIVAITSRNAGSVRTRTVASAIYNMSVQASNIIGSNVYRDPDKPLYRTGNKALLGLVAFNVVTLLGIKAFYVRKNHRREAIWSHMNKEEREHYLRTTKDQGNRRLDFRFAH